MSRSNRGIFKEERQSPATEKTRHLALKLLSPNQINQIINDLKSPDNVNAILVKEILAHLTEVIESEEKPALSDEHPNWLAIEEGLFSEMLDYLQSVGVTALEMPCNLHGKEQIAKDFFAEIEAKGKELAAEGDSEQEENDYVVQSNQAACFVIESYFKFIAPHDAIARFKLFQIKIGVSWPNTHLDLPGQLLLAKQIMQQFSVEDSRLIMESKETTIPEQTAVLDRFKHLYYGTYYPLYRKNEIDSLKQIFQRHEFRSGSDGDPYRVNVRHIYNNYDQDKTDPLLKELIFELAERHLPNFTADSIIDKEKIALCKKLETSLESELTAKLTESEKVANTLLLQNNLTTEKYEDDLAKLQHDIVRAKTVLEDKEIENKTHVAQQQLTQTTNRMTQLRSRIENLREEITDLPAEKKNDLEDKLTKLNDELDKSVDRTLEELSCLKSLQEDAERFKSLEEKSHCFSAEHAKIIEEFNKKMADLLKHYQSIVINQFTTERKIIFGDIQKSIIETVESHFSDFVFGQVQEQDLRQKILAPLLEKMDDLINQIQVELNQKYKEQQNSTMEELLNDTQFSKVKSKQPFIQGMHDYHAYLVTLEQDIRALKMQQDEIERRLTVLENRMMNNEDNEGKVIADDCAYFLIHGYSLADELDHYETTDDDETLPEYIPPKPSDFPSLADELIKDYVDPPSPNSVDSLDENKNEFSNIAMSGLANELCEEINRIQSNAAKLSIQFKKNGTATATDQVILQFARYISEDIADPNLFIVRMNEILEYTNERNKFTVTAEGFTPISEDAPSPRLFTLFDLRMIQQNLIKAIKDLTQDEQTSAIITALESIDCTRNPHKLVRLLSIDSNRSDESKSAGEIRSILARVPTISIDKILTPEKIQNMRENALFFAVRRLGNSAEAVMLLANNIHANCQRVVIEKNASLTTEKLASYISDLQEMKKKIVGYYNLMLEHVRPHTERDQVSIHNYFEEKIHHATRMSPFHNQYTTIEEVRDYLLKKVDAYLKKYSIELELKVYLISFLTHKLKKYINDSAQESKNVDSFKTLITTDLLTFIHKNLNFILTKKSAKKFLFDIPAREFRDSALHIIHDIAELYKAANIDYQQTFSEQLTKLNINQVRASEKIARLFANFEKNCRPLGFKFSVKADGTITVDFISKMHEMRNIIIKEIRLLLTKIEQKEALKLIAFVKKVQYTNQLQNFLQSLLSIDLTESEEYEKLQSITTKNESEQIRSELLVIKFSAIKEDMNTRINFVNQYVNQINLELFARNRHHTFAALTSNATLSANACLKPPTPPSTMSPS